MDRTQLRPVIRISLVLWSVISQATGNYAFSQPAGIRPSEGASGKFTRLVFQDEFSVAGLPDTIKWRYDTGYLRNHESQYYTLRRKENALVQNDLLSLIARNDSLRSNGHVYPITSAAIRTQEKFSFTYGRVEVRARIPSATGIWPAIWMLGSDIDQTGWPACGEIDIMEHVGYIPDSLHFNVHTGKYNHVKKTNKGVRVFIPSPEKEFHIYALEWFPGHLDWFLDGKKVFDFPNERSGAAAWPFDKPQFPILNLAIGGDWGGLKGVDINALPLHFDIDYVRVFQ